jgi:hypothetical protein
MNQFEKGANIICLFFLKRGGDFHQITKIEGPRTGRISEQEFFSATTLFLLNFRRTMLYY